MTDLSVVIVNWNAGALLRRCVESVLCSSTGLSIEIIVVDNASTDQSTADLNQCRDRVSVVENSANVGFARACNQGVEMSSGQYVVLLGPDSQVMPGALKTMVDFMDGHPEAGAAGPALLYPDGRLQPSGGSFPTFRRLLGIHPLIMQVLPATEDPLRRRDFTKISEVDEVSGACLLIRRAAIEKIGVLDEGFFLYFEDIDWCLRLKQGGLKVYYLPHARIKHHWRSQTDPSPHAQLHYLRSRFYYVRKHFGSAPYLVLRLVAIAVYGALTAKAMARCLLDSRPSMRQELRICRELFAASCGY